VLVGIAALVAAPADGHGAAHNGLIAIATVDRSGGSQIRLFTADVQPRRVVRVQASVDLPRFSPDGRWLAFWAGPDPDRSVPWIAASDGTSPRPLLPVPDAREPATEHWGPPVWAPDNRRLAYVDDHANEGSTTDVSTIHIIGTNGRGNHPLSITGWRGSTTPRSFALVAWRGSRMLTRSNASGREFVIDLRRRTVTQLPGVDSLSPNGRRVACADAGRLSTIDLGTGKRRQITAVTSARGVPVWSPDASALAVRTSHGIEIVAANASSAAPRLIRTVATNLAWSPDAMYLLTDRPALIALRNGAVVPVRHLSPSSDYGSPLDWQ